MLIASHYRIKIEKPSNFSHKIPKYKINPPHNYHKLNQQNNSSFHRICLK